jgi:hypothetical protein
MVKNLPRRFRPEGVESREWKDARSRPRWAHGTGKAWAEGRGGVEKMFSHSETAAVFFEHAATARITAHDTSARGAS